MSLTPEQIEAAALALTADERERLGRLLLDSVVMDFNDPAEVERAWLVEIERRRERLHSGETKGVPFEEAMARIQVRRRCA